MNKPLLPLLALAAVVVPVTLAMRPAADPTSAPQDNEAQEPTPLQRSMGILQRHQRSLRKLVKDPVASKVKLTKALGEMEGAILVGLQNLPSPREGMKPEEVALWHVGYKQTMVTLLSSVLEMQKATLEGDAAALGAAAKALGQTKKAGHESYQ